MSEFRFQLDPGSKKRACPNCDKKRFVRYINVTQGEYLPEQFGRCDREDNCGYHLNPYKAGYGTPFPLTNEYIAPQKNISTPSYIEFDVVKKSMKAYNANSFVLYLNSLFDHETVNKLISRYFVGTARHFGGAIVFWQVDFEGNVRTGEVMKYHSDGHRVKVPRSLINYAHKLLGLKKFNLSQCFFGEHLLSQFPDAIVGIVESAKTAIIASAYFPKYIWLATTGSSGCKWRSLEVNGVLRERDVVLFPDLGQFDNWKRMLKILPAKSVRIEDLLETNATDSDREQGYDLADYLSQFSLVSFLK